MRSFSDRVAAITGAASGIGRALAIALADEGCHLALSDVNDAGLEETAGLVRGRTDVAVSTAHLDVSDRAAVHAWADDVADTHGRVNLIFNNAGVAHSGTVENTPYEDLDWIVGINFWGVVHGTRAFLPYLRASGEGHIVNVSSIFGLFAQPSMSAYNATKFAVRGFTEALRQELELEKAPVSATCVHPGGIKTNIAANARFAGPTALGEAHRARAFTERVLLTVTPQRAAAQILRGVRRNQRRVLVGVDARALDLLQRGMPASYQRLVTGTARLIGR